MDTWDILQKETAHFGVKVINSKICQINNKQAAIPVVISKLQKDLEENKKLFLHLWLAVQDTLNEQTAPAKCSDVKQVDLFIFSLKDLSKLIMCMGDLDKSQLKTDIDFALAKDVSYFDNHQINVIPNYKMSIDWVLRLIQRANYLCNLLKLAMTGETNVANQVMKMAKGISGPWANLDLPSRERVYDWWEEDANFRGRDKDIRGQRRYTKGFENYNNDGSVGEGHYWREIRNEPFSWYDRKTEDPYSHRDLLTRG